ncbi:MAG: BrnT family toxin [Rubrobacter sp.]|nr:BrnT family toxin [Rubrobacter sp.]
MFDGNDFDWDEANIGHVARHEVEPWEAEEALLDTGRVGTAAYNVRGETRWATLGATEAGRVLFVVSTRRAEKIRVVTARDAEDKEKRRYRRG